MLRALERLPTLDCTESCRQPTGLSILQRHREHLEPRVLSIHTGAAGALDVLEGTICYRGTVRTAPQRYPGELSLGLSRGPWGASRGLPGGLSQGAS